MPAPSPKQLRLLIQNALQEDKAFSDVTSKALLPFRAAITAAIIAKETGIVAGVEAACLCFSALDPAIQIKQRVKSGKRVVRGAKILTLTGPARSLFAAERAALNFLGHLSGIATLTRAYADKVKGTRAVILDTRKTIPGLRLLEKHAVIAGGGKNHRFTLQDQVLIKTNHLRVLAREGKFSSVVREAVIRARQANPRKFIAVEVVNLKEFAQALLAKPNMILLDNWPLRRIAAAVKLRRQRKSRALLEVSGGVTLKNVRAIAKTGVDRISIGRLTHSAPSLDISLKVL